MSMEILHVVWIQFITYSIILLGNTVTAGRTDCDGVGKLSCYFCIHMKDGNPHSGCELGRLGDMELTEKVNYYSLRRDLAESWTPELKVNMRASNRSCAYCIKDFGKKNAIVARGKVTEDDPNLDGICQPQKYDRDVKRCYCSKSGCNVGFHLRPKPGIFGLLVLICLSLTKHCY